MFTSLAGRERAALAILVLAALLVSFQGWRAIPHDDEAGRMISKAVLLAQRGVIPQFATTTDLGSYFPPGTVWLDLPGLWLFDDVRLVERGGGSLLYVGTILGVFAVSRRWFGPRTALIAAAAYAFSSVGLALSTGLWPRGHPFFYVWMLYFIERWVRERQPRELCAALTVWFVGMYVHMELAPAILMVVVAWAVYRPPLATTWWVAAAAVTLVIWFPYLRFQRDRGFIDLISQLTVTSITDDDAPAAEFSWCVPEMVYPARFMDRPPPLPLREQLTAIRDSALMPLGSRVPFGNWLLLTWFAGAVLVVSRGRDHTDTVKLAAVTLVPWLVLVAFGEDRRVMGPWPLLVILLAGTAGHLDAAIRRRVPVRGVASFALLVLIALNLSLLGRARDLRAHGWSGVDSLSIGASRSPHLDCSTEN